jgi:hypothetical protein
VETGRSGDGMSCTVLHYVPRGPKVTGCLAKSDVLARAVHDAKAVVLPMASEK